RSTVQDGSQNEFNVGFRDEFRVLLRDVQRLDLLLRSLNDNANLERRIWDLHSFELGRRLVETGLDPKVELDSLKRSINFPICEGHDVDTLVDIFAVRCLIRRARHEDIREGLTFVEMSVYQERIIFRPNIPISTHYGTHLSTAD